MNYDLQGFLHEHQYFQIERDDHQNSRVSYKVRSLWCSSPPKHVSVMGLWDELLESLMHVDGQTLTQRHTQAPVHSVDPAGVGGNPPWIQDIVCSMNVADRRACCRYMSEYLVGDKASFLGSEVGQLGVSLRADATSPDSCGKGRESLWLVS